MKKSDSVSSRTKNSVYNMIASMLANSLSIIIGLIARVFFIRYLGNEYLGLNGLFSNIISMLSIVELGMGSTIIYNLYKPIANNDIDTIKSLMQFYKKSYHLIGITILILGIVLIPFLPSIIGNTEIPVNSTIIYLLFLADSVFSYFLSYKRSMLYAQQKDYVVQYVNIFYLVTLNLVQIIILMITKNYYLYLSIKILFRVVENVIINIIANRLYPYLKDDQVKPLEQSIQKDIFKKIKALFFHQIGSFVINGTDNIIISRYLGIAVVGLYSNYYMIINAVRTVTKQIISATTPSVGNLLVTESKDKQYSVFKKIRFANFWIACFCGVCIYVLMEPFITIWIGNEYILDNFVLLVLSINFFQKTMRDTYGAFKNAAGIFYEDRFVPIIESVINIVVSIFLVKRIGLAGVFVGTIVSGLVLWLYSYPVLVYKKIFNRNYLQYLRETIGYILAFLIVLFLTNFLSTKVLVSSAFISLILKFLVCLVVPNLVMFIVFGKTSDFKYFLSNLNILLKKIKRKTVKKG